VSLVDDAERIAARARDMAVQLRRAIGSISDRHAIYAAVFRPGGKMSPAAAKVLDDLAAFCGADESIYHDDARRHAKMEGRREVYLHIQTNLKLDGEKLAALRRELREHEL
jgi:hypothetical protein